jgi:hypothetical protein
VQADHQRSWHMAGMGLAAPLTLTLAAASVLAPPEFDPALIPMTRRVPGALFAAQYDLTSSLSYNEFGIGLFGRSTSRRLGFFPARLWVDNPDSVNAGRQIWGLSKRLARFTWTRGQSDLALRVELEESALINLSLSAPGVGMSFPLAVRCVSFDPAGRALRWKMRSRSTLRRGRLQVEIPPGSPVAALLPGRRFRGVCLDPLDLIFSFPGTPQGMAGNSI